MSDGANDWEVPIVRGTRLWMVLGFAAALILAAVVVTYVNRPRVLYRVTFLPAMGGVETRGHAINDLGQVISSVRWADGTRHIFLWDKSDQPRELASFAKGHQVASLTINNAGQIAGTIMDPNQAWSSFFWDTDGRKYTLATPAGGRSHIRALNNRGQVVGYWGMVQGPRHAFLWDKTAAMQDLGTFGGIESVACDLNDKGQAVGFVSTSANPRWRAFLYDPNLGLRELGPAKFGPAATCCINNQSFVVGQFGSAEDETCVSIWTAGTGPLRLRPTDGDSLDVRALNDANQFFLNVHRRGLRLWGRKLWQRAESHWWESTRHIRCLNQHLGRTDVEGFSVQDINRDGTILGALSVEKFPYPHPVILEPIEK